MTTLPSAEELAITLVVGGCPHARGMPSPCESCGLERVKNFRNAVLEAAAEVADVYGTPDSLLSCIPDAIAAEIRKLKEELK